LRFVLPQHSRFDSLNFAPPSGVKTSAQLYYFGDKTFNDGDNWSVAYGGLDGSGRSRAGARALLGWSQTQLARRAGLGLATLQRIERDEGIEKGKFSTVIKIQKALEQAGIHFTEDDTGEIGVRLKIKRR
jgi:DNA-binding XRE family transcriptional regulator